MFNPESSTAKSSVAAGFVMLCQGEAFPWASIALACQWYPPGASGGAETLNVAPELTKLLVIVGTLRNGIKDGSSSICNAAVPESGTCKVAVKTGLASAITLPSEIGVTPSLLNC